MALDQVEVMKHFGFDRFPVVGHDRGGRVAHRMALDHPEKVTRLAVLDIAPTYYLYTHVTIGFVQAYFHWFNYLRPAPGPEDQLKAEVEARAAGLRFFSIPFDRAGRPDDAEIKQVLDIIDTPEYQPVLVHCKQGVDRTGTVIAIYRITHDGWTSEQAKAEANRYGMHPWQRGMKNYIHDYYLRFIQEKATRSH